MNYEILIVLGGAQCFSRLWYIPRLEDVPDVMAGQIQRDLGLGEDVRSGV